MSMESTRLTGKTISKTARVIQDDGTIVSAFTVVTANLTSTPVGIYRVTAFDDEDPNDRGNGSVKAYVDFSGSNTIIKRSTIILTDSVNVTITPGITITPATPLVGSTFTFEVQDHQDVYTQPFTLNGAGSLIASGMSVVTLWDKIATAGNIPDPWLSPIIDCRGFSAISFHSNGSTGTTPPSTIQLLGSTSNITPSNMTDFTYFAQCISTGGSGGPSAIFINGLATGSAKAGPRISVSHPYHILRLTGQVSWKANLFAILHTGGHGGTG